MLNPTIIGAGGGTGGDTSALEARVTTVESEVDAIQAYGSTVPGGYGPAVLVGTVTGIAADATLASLGAEGTFSSFTFEVVAGGYTNGLSAVNSWTVGDVLAQWNQEAQDLFPQDGVSFALEDGRVVLRCTTSDVAVTVGLPIFGWATGATAARTVSPERSFIAPSSAIRHGDGSTEEAIDGLAGRIAALEAVPPGSDPALADRVTAAEGEIDALQAADTALGNRVSALEGEPDVDLAPLEGRVSTLESTASGHETRIAALEGEPDVDLTPLTNRIATAEGEIDALQSADTGHVSRLTALESTDADLTSRVIALETASGGSGGTADLWTGTTVLNVPGDHPTVYAALNAVLLKSRAAGAKVEIHVADGIHYHSGSFVLDGIDLSWVEIKSANALVEHAMTGTSVSISGAQRAWSNTYTLTEAQAATYAAGDLVLADNRAASALPSVYTNMCVGVGRVTAVSGADVTIAMTHTNSFITSSPTVQSYASTTLLRFRAVIETSGPFLQLRNGARSPLVRDIGFVGPGGIVGNNVIAFEVDGGSELNLYQAPGMYASQPRRHVAIHGFYHGVVATEGSLVRGAFAVGACWGGGVYILSGSRLRSKGLMSVGNGVGQLAAPAAGQPGGSYGLMVDSTSEAKLTDAPAQHMPSHICCNAGQGVFVEDAARVTIGKGAINSNTTQDVYANNRGDVILGANADIAVNTVSPAVNTLGNNQSFIRRP